MRDVSNIWWSKNEFRPKLRCWKNIEIVKKIKFWSEILENTMPFLALYILLIYVLPIQYGLIRREYQWGPKCKTNIILEKTCSKNASACTRTKKVNFIAKINLLLYVQNIWSPRALTHMARVSRPIFRNHLKMPKIGSGSYFWLIKTILKSKN